MDEQTDEGMKGGREGGKDEQTDRQMKGGKGWREGGREGERRKDGWTNR